MQLSRFLPARFSRSRLVVPVVRLAGVIATGGTPLRQNLSLASVAPLLERAFSMKHTPVVALAINSPGGSPVQSRLIYSRIRELADKHSKRVLVFVEDVAASGGYMIALAGDEIIADESSIVGSIGVVSASFGFDKAIGKIGVERRVYTAGENKVLLDPFKPERKKDIDHLKSLQGQIHQLFIDMVKSARGARLASDADLFSGLFWTGATARELGLVDHCGLMAPIIAERYGPKAQLKLVSPRRSLFGRPQLGVGVGEGRTGLAGIGADLAAELPRAILDAAADRALWGRYGL